MEPFNRENYKIEHRTREEKSVKYVLCRKKDEEVLICSRTKSKAENELNKMEAYSKIEHLPTFKEFVYCFSKEDFLNYATFIGFKYPIYDYFFSLDYYPDDYFIKHIDEIWDGPDWYFLETVDYDDEIAHHWNTFKKIRGKLENEINRFIDELENPKSWDETYCSEGRE